MHRKPGLHPALTAIAAAVLILIFLGQILSAVNREVTTNDEGYHTYAGFRYWQCADFGVNPEHPPLAKMVAALPLRLAHIPAPEGPCPVASTTKGTGYGDTDRWQYTSASGASQAYIDRVLPMARHAMVLFALLLAATAFLLTRRMYGDSSALLALALITFEPTLIAHGALVTTDMALSATSLLAVAAFYIFHRNRTVWRLLFAGLSCGLALSVKHSGVLILPTLTLIAALELAYQWKTVPAKRTEKILREGAALMIVLAIGVIVLWATYHFRYAARPDGIRLTQSLTDFITDTKAKENRSLMLAAIPFLARHHILPEAYLYGFVDVLSISNPGQSSFLFGHLYPHGVPQYFPSVILIKSTLGMLGLALLSLLILTRRRFRLGLSAAYLLVPSSVWLLAGMASTLNIGYRHILPVIAPACCLIAAAIVYLWRETGPPMRIAIACLLIAHVVSSLASFPNEIAYGNEAFGGVSNSHNLLTDSNNDWGQALPQVAAWLQVNQQGECWFAYDGFARPTYSGINCHRMIANLFEPNASPTGDAGLSQTQTQTGTFIISGLSESGIEWERPDLNPYEVFQKSKPVAVIGGADMVYQGTFDLSRVTAIDRLALAMNLNSESRFAQALPAAEAALAALPTSALAHLQVANALKGVGRIDQAHREYQAAESIASVQPEWYFLQRQEIRSGLSDTATPAAH